MHKSSMSAHKLNWVLLNQNIIVYFPKEGINKTKPSWILVLCIMNKIPCIF
jgi:hypothetical protein